MRKHLAICLIVYLLLVACSPQVEVDSGQTNESEEPVFEQVEETPMPEEESDESDFNDSEDADVESDEDTIEAEEQKSEPTVVDLGELMTPTAESGGEKVEQPAPGIPDRATVLLNDVQQDLSKKLDVDLDAIETVAVEEVTWRDSSLGCPIAGMNYLQVLTPGFRIILMVDGEEYHYHSRDTSNFVLCEDPQPPVSGEQAPPPGLGDD